MSSIARVGWWLPEAGRPGVSFELGMPLVVFWSRCRNTERHEADLRFCWSNSLEDHHLGARSFVRLFLSLGARPGFSCGCLRQKQRDFCWMALGLSQSGGTGSALHCLGWSPTGRYCPCKAARSQGWCRGVLRCSSSHCSL